MEVRLNESYILLSRIKTKQTLVNNLFYKNLILAEITDTIKNIYWGEL